MDKEILDYSDYSIWETAYGINTPGSVMETFYDKLGWCPFCNRKAQIVYNKGDSFTYDFGPWRELTETVWECNCGWWQISYYSYMEEERNYKDWQKTIHNAQLKKFFIDSSNIPINTLRSYIEKNEDKIFLINDKKMEELVASVFSEHYKCNVKIVGKSHDGGIDLILIESHSSPTIIQVKRRKSKNKIENVKEIRDLLGATVLSQSTKCAFVTTADHFSRDAINTRNLAIERNIVESFELYDYKRFFEILHLNKSCDFKHWNCLLQFENNIKT